MYFTDRGIEELARRRGTDEVSLEWLADRLREFVDLNPDFEIAVERGRPAAVMAAYHRLNGTYCSDNSWLLRDVLRDEWGFEGLKIAAQNAFTSDAAGTTAYGTSIGYVPLRRWLAERHGVSESRVLVTNGSMQADAFLFDALVQPGDLLVAVRIGQQVA